MGLLQRGCFGDLEVLSAQDFGNETPLILIVFYDQEADVIHRFLTSGE
jgi:hypothetical protein